MGRVDLKAYGKIRHAHDVTQALIRNANSDTLASSVRSALEEIASSSQELKRRDRFTRFCGGRGKVRHASQGAAQAALRSLIRRGDFA